MKLYIAGNLSSRVRETRILNLICRRLYSYVHVHTDSRWHKDFMIAIKRHST